MEIEERIERLEQENEALRKKVELLEVHVHDEFVTPMELAEIMSCDVNTVYYKIRAGKIKAVTHVGGYRIPMYQFYDTPDALSVRRRRAKNVRGEVHNNPNPTMRDIVFGKG